LLSALRSFYPELIHSDRNPLQLLIGQLRYASHTLSFPEANVRQKQWALYTACLCAQAIERRILEQQGELWIAWLPRLRTAPGRMGLTMLPGRRDRQRQLARDLETIKAQGVSHVVCLVSQQELEDYGVPQLLEAYAEAQLIFLHLPIVDQGTLPVEDLLPALNWIQDALDDKGHVLIHCVGGLGRSGMLAACYLRSKSLPAKDALAEIRAIRSSRAIETAAQEALVTQFEGCSPDQSEG
jgi:protein-tyrosine phosphatase